MSPDEVAARIVTLFRTRGDSTYGGERLSQTEHALQCALAAERAEVSEPLIVASLLHDIGHLLHDVGDDAAERGIDARHEDLGAAWLKDWFGPEVTEPVRLHVPAKRYLCAVDPAYTAGLSAGSIASLRVQGGPMTEAEQAAFEALPFHAEAVSLRRFDDVGKVRGLPVPDIETYRTRIAAQVRADAAPTGGP